MDALAIQNVTLAIAAQLKTALAAAGVVGNQSPFVGPLDDPQAINAALVLFLYRVTASQALRNTDHVVGPANANDTEHVYATALPLDLHYLVTVGRQQAAEPDELRVLGFAMQSLNDAAVLSGTPVEGETVRLTLDTATSEELSRIWALFPTVNYRTSVLYLASPVWIDPVLAPSQAPPVTDERLVVGFSA